MTKKINIFSFNNFVGLLTIFFLFLTSCTKEDREIQLSQQIKEIDNFAKNSASGGKRVVVNNGSTRVVINEGNGDPVIAGDSVFIDYAGYIFQSGLGTLFDTNVESVSETFGINIYNRGFDCGKNIVGKGIFIEGLDLGLIGAKIGEQAYIVFPANLGFGNKDVGLVPKMSPLIYEVWIKEIKKN